MRQDLVHIKVTNSFLLCLLSSMNLHEDFEEVLRVWWVDKQSMGSHTVGDLALLLSGELELPM